MLIVFYVCLMSLVTFKKMYVQKQKELLKLYEKQEKKLKDLKAGGKSTKQAVSSWVLLPDLNLLKHSLSSSVLHSQEKQTKEALTRKQQKGKKKGQEEESNEATELIRRPKEYTVKFTFPNPPPLSPPILGLHSELLDLCFYHFLISLICCRVLYLNKVLSVWYEWFVSVLHI